jgi:hypothetical protein
VGHPKVCFRKVPTALLPARRRAPVDATGERRASFAVTIAVHDSQIGDPWADGVTVLVRHHAGNLVQMSQIVSGPGSEQFGQSAG